MTSFIIIALFICLPVLAILVRPLLKTNKPRSYERQAQNIHYAKERLSELEEQLKTAAISADDYEALKREIESTLAQDIDLVQPQNDSNKVSEQGSNRLLILLICCIIPVSALLTYKLTGTPQALNPSAQAVKSSTSDSAQNMQRPSKDEIDGMLSSIEERLKEQPDDLEGWTVLARTYLALGRYDDSIKAYLEVLRLDGENPNTYAALADASALQSDGVIKGTPNDFVKKALALDANHPQALWLAGLNAAQQDNKTSALEYWNKLMPQLASSPKQQQELRELIVQLSEPSAIASKTPASVDDSANSQRTELGSEQSPDLNSGKNMASSNGDNSDGLTVHVELAPSMLAQANDNDVVFIYVRAKSGPKAPLAVKRVQVKDLPATLSLSDSDAMLAQFKISLFEDVVVSARLSKSGQPIAQAGDIQSDIVDSKNTNAQTIKLVISELVK